MQEGCKNEQKRRSSPCQVCEGGSKAKLCVRLEEGHWCDWNYKGIMGKVARELARTENRRIYHGRAKAKRADERRQAGG